MEQETLVLSMPLTEEECVELTRCENIIQHGLPTVFEVGKAFKTIIDRKLYRETHKTAEDYFREKWDLSRPRAYQLIDSVTVKENVEAGLSTTGRQNLPLPTTERQTRALKQVPAEKQADLWQKAVDGNNGKPPTSKQIIQVIETEFEVYKPKKPPKQFWREGDYYEVPEHGAVKILEYDANANEVHVQEMMHGKKMWMNPNRLGASCSEEFVLSTTESEDRMYFDMLFDVDDDGECERLKQIVFASELYNLPFMADVAAKKGLCKECSYASHGHYLNEKGYKWCTLSIVNDLTLRELLKTDKIQILDANHKPEAPDSDANTCPECFEDDGKHKTSCSKYTEPEPVDLPEQPAKIGVVWNKVYDPTQKDVAGTPEFWFGKCTLDSWQLFIRYYYQGNENGNLIDENMKLKHDIKGLQSEIEKLKNDVNYAAEAYAKVRKIQTGLECELADNAGFESRRTGDLDKIMRSGIFRIFRVDDYAKVIKEYTTARNTVTEMCSGTWKIFEKFDTKKAMYAKAADLQQDEHVIFAGMLFV